MKKSMYQLKVQAVLMHQSGISMYQICRELHICTRSLHLWLAIYKKEGEQGLRKSYKQHKSVSEKLGIIEDILNNALSLSEASKKYLVTPHALQGWLKAYQTHGVNGLHRKNEAGKTMARKKREYTQDELDELTELRRRNEWLEAENAMLKKAKALVEAKRAQQLANGQESSEN